MKMKQLVHRVDPHKSPLNSPLGCLLQGFLMFCSFPIVVLSGSCLLSSIVIIVLGKRVYVALNISGLCLVYCHGVFAFLFVTLRKHAYSNILKFLPPKK